MKWYECSTLEKVPIRLYSQLSTIKNVGDDEAFHNIYIYLFLTQMKKNIHKSFLSRSS